MKIKKIQLEAIFQMLKGTEGVLDFKDSRIRDSILKPLADTLQTYYDDRNKIYQAFCLKKEDGTPDYLEENGETKYQFPKEKLDEINKELLALADEEVDMYTTDNPLKFREIMLKSEYKPKVGESEQIEGVME